jgi:phospholipase/carboxylesterase
MTPHIDRREMLRALAVGAAGVVVGCREGFDPTGPRQGNARLTARPGNVTGVIASGEHTLTLPSGRTARIIVPASYTGDPLPFALLLHGFSSNAQGALQPFRTFADNREIILLAIDASGNTGTWDALDRRWGQDVVNIDEALAFAFSRVAVDPARLAVEGFSDGATYALALGRANGDLFTRIAAQSPGFIFPLAEVGSPAIYITHGIFDAVFPIDETGLAIADELSARYDVRYVEYEGGHELPHSVASDVAAWIAAPAA